MAEANGVQVGCAPDTVLGTGTQTARQALDEGIIGQPVGVQAYMLCGGHESWHPSPEFYYKVGGGPLHDMGPYYLSCLITLLGPVKRVTGMASVTHPTRTITSQPLNGTVITVDTPTHIIAVLEFASGVIANLTTSFDTPSAELPHIEIHGSAGALRVPDPNGFGGDVLIRKPGESGWTTLDPGQWEAGAGRGLGVVEMIRAGREGRAARASGALGLHVLEVMDGVLQASSSGLTVDLTTTVAQPAPMTPGGITR
jgi:predicted dehydrogenase